MQKINDYGIILNNIEDGSLKIRRFIADEKWAKFVYDNRTNAKFIRPDYDIIIGPIADNTLQNWFNKIDEEGLSFSEIAAKIQYNKFKDNQFAFCTAKSLKLLKWVSCHVESSMQFVLSSSSFKDLHEKPFLLEEGDLFLFDLLKKEFIQNSNH